MEASRKSYIRQHRPSPTCPRPSLPKVAPIILISMSSFRAPTVGFIFLLNHSLLVLGFSHWGLLLLSSLLIYLIMVYTYT